MAFSLTLPVLTLLFLCVGAIITEAAELRGCESKYVEGADSPYIWCDARDDTSSLEWTLVTETGVSAHLGTCDTTIGPCPSPYNSTVLSLNRYSQATSLAAFPSVGSQFEGTLTCSEIFTNGTVEDVSCQLNLVRIIMRTKKQSDILEDSTWAFGCFQNPSFDPVRWTVTTPSGQTRQLGTCTGVNSCTSLLPGDVTLRKQDATYSEVAFMTMDRDMAGVLSCAVVVNGVEEADTTTVNIYHNPTVSDCGVEVVYSNWSATIFCQVSQLFSSAAVYEFVILDAFKVRIGSDLRSTSGDLFNDRVSFGDTLTSYVDINTNRTYYSGRVGYSWPLPPLAGTYTQFGLLLYYGYEVYMYKTMSYELNITLPSRPAHNCTYLKRIPETGLVPCVCAADDLGSPAGRLVWLLGDIAIATGGYGVKRLSLPSGNISRRDDGTWVTCQLDWLQPTTDHLTRHVAYGPDNVTLQVAQSHDASNSLIVHVISHVTGMQPMREDMFQWGGACQGQHGFTCTLTPDSAAAVAGKVVTCRVVNAENNGRSAQGSVVVRLNGQIEEATSSEQEKQEQEHDSGPDMDVADWTVVVLGIALGVVILVILLVLVVLHERGCLCKEPAEKSADYVRGSNPVTDATYDNAAFATEKETV